VPRIHSGEGIMKNKLTFLALGLALLAGSCSRQATESNEILIGEYGSLTGTTATFGLSTKNGVDLAIEQINAAGGVLGKQIRVIVEDDQGKPEEAQTVVTKLINSDKVVVVIGEVASSRTLAAAPVAQQAKIPMVTPSSTNPKVTQIGDYIFRTCFIDPFQGLVMAKFATITLKVKNVAILRDIKNDYSVGLADVFVENFQKLGGKIVADQSYSEGDTDFSAQLTAMKDTKPEAIFVPGYYTEVGLIARQARKLGISVPLLGGDGWDSPRLYEIGGEALNGSYFSNHTSVDDPAPAIQKFVSQYKAKYGEIPDSLGANAYDTARIVVDAIKRAGSTDPAKLRDALAQVKDFPGIAGPISIDANRNALKPAVILKVNGGKLDFVERVMP
jgi:branched-chain amino acid transport system substrate-binding protein